ncbi:UNVERIFIED_CONTAM: hypothetical protein Slati_2570400 [Sesamum latifolium]|uniref:Uncharacterized protein n=1 Tax=Sesamum latifolium TaxID=2727402 RepID=A0AAW2VS79_9LAMI
MVAMEHEECTGSEEGGRDSEEEMWLEALKKLGTEALLKKDGLTARHLEDLMKELLAKSLETEETEGLAEI